MDEHRLSFSTAFKLADDLAEFINDEGVEITIEMVDEYHHWVRANLASPALILVNKRNAYSYTFEAQQYIGTAPEIRAIAFVTYNAVSTLTTRDLAEQPRPRPWRARIFDDRELALEWLTAQRGIG